MLFINCTKFSSVINLRRLLVALSLFFSKNIRRFYIIQIERQDYKIDTYFLEVTGCTMFSIQIGIATIVSAQFSLKLRIRVNCTSQWSEQHRNDGNNDWAVVGRKHKTCHTAHGGCFAIILTIIYNDDLLCSMLGVIISSVILTNYSKIYFILFQ